MAADVTVLAAVVQRRTDKDVVRVFAEAAWVSALHLLVAAVVLVDGRVEPVAAPGTPQVVHVNVPVPGTHQLQSFPVA